MFTYTIDACSDCMLPILKSLPVKLIGILLIVCDLHLPGCNTDYSWPYPSCATRDLQNSCANLNTEECLQLWPKSQFCSLMGDCLDRLSSCSCYGAANQTDICADISLPNEDNDVHWNEFFPGFTLVAETTLVLESERSNKIILVPANDIVLQQYDVIGIQYVAAMGHSPILCEANENSKWKNNVMKGFEANWMQQLQRPAFTSGAYWQENIACEIEAIFSGPKTVSAPINLIKPYSLQTGEYVYTAVVSNLVSSQSVSKSVTMIYSIDGFDLILPNSVPNRPRSTAHSKLAVQANATSNFLWIITKGTQVTGTWDLNPANFTFAIDCPQQFSDISDCQRSNTQFVHTAHVFPFIGEDDVVPVVFYASNPISSADFVYDIVAQIPVVNLTLEIREPMIFRANNSVLLLAKIDSGTHVTYTWEVDNNIGFDTDTGETSYTFPAAGYHRVQVAAANGLGSLHSQGTVTLIAEAALGNLHIEVPSVVIAGSAATILASVDINRYSMVSFHFDLGDGSSVQREDRVDGLRTTTVANEAVQHSFSLQENEEMKEVVVTVIAVDNLHWNKTKTPLLLDMKEEFGALWINKTVQVVREIQTSQIDFTSPNAAYPTDTSIGFSAVQTGGTGTIYFNWNFDDGGEVLTTRDSVVEHEFENPGVYTLSVEISNNASAVSASISVYIEEKIENLELTYDGPTPIGQTTTITAISSAGSPVTYEFKPGDGTVGPVQDVPSFRHEYRTADEYVAKVKAFNNVSQSSASIAVYIMDEQTLKVVDIESEDCVGVNEENVFTAVVAHLDPNSLYYQWHFSSGAYFDGVGLREVHKTFINTGSYTIAVTVSEISNVGNSPTFSSRSLQDIGSPNFPFRPKSDFHHISVCAQERIGGVEVTTNSPLAVRGGDSTEVRLEISLGIENGSDYWVTWIYNGTSESQDFIFTPEISYRSVGIYTLKLVVENDIGRVVVLTDVDVQEIIEEPSITYNATSNYLSTKESYKFTSDIEYGTSVSYRWEFYPVQNDSNVRVVDAENAVVQMSQTGTFFVKLTVTNDVSNGSDSVEIFLLDPILNLETSANATSVLMGNSVQFVSQIAEGSSVTYSWTVCKGSDCEVVFEDAEEPEFIYRFGTAGDFNVKVQASNEINSETSEVIVVVIGPVQNGSIAVSSPALLEGRYVSQGTEIHVVGHASQGSNVLYSWEIYWPSGELFQFEGSTASLELTEVGEYVLLLNVSNVFSHQIVEYEIEALQTLNDVSIVSLNGTRGSPGDRMTFQVDLGNTVSPETVYNWSIRKVGFDTEFAVEEGQGRIMHLFSEYGVYDISVEVSNRLNVGRDQIRITIAEDIGVVEIVLGGNNTHYVRKGKTIVFRGTFDQGTSTRFEWMFTDSNPPRIYTTQQVSHAFQTVGKFKVKLNVSNSVSFTNVSLTIYSEEPIANLSIGVNGTGATGRLTALSDPLAFVAATDTGSNLTYAWDFGEGDGLIVNSRRTVVHKFSSTGIFKVKAIVSNDLGIARESINITVQERIKGLRIVDCCDEVVSIGTWFVLEAEITAGSDVTYVWNIEEPNGHTVRKEQEKFAFELEHHGRYSVRLEARNQLGSAFANEDLLTEEEITDVKIEGPKSVYDGHNATYIAVTTGGTNVKYQWRFNLREQPNEVSMTFRRLFTIEDLNIKFVWLVVKAYNDISEKVRSFFIEVKLLECEPLEVIPVGGTKRSELRSRSVHLEARVLSNCTQNRYPIIYYWNVYKAECPDVRDDTEEVRLHGIDKRTPTLAIPGGHMDMPYGNYCAKFTAEYALNPPVETIVSIDLEITKSPLVAMIIGGDERCFSSDTKIILDGSESYDPDDGSSDLRHIWKCYETVRNNNNNNNNINLIL